jgi:hypothetical protein
MIKPCYVIASNGFKSSVSYEDDWCYGRSRHLATVASGERDVIKADIRRQPDERNGLPIYSISDHGNVSRVRAIRLRRI